MIGWGELLGASAGWATLVWLVTQFFHNRRVTAIDGLKQEIHAQAAEAKTAHAELQKQFAASHDALRVQVTDMAISFAANYVQRRDFDSILHSLNDNVSEGRKEVGAVGIRIDQLFRTAQFRGDRPDG